MSRAKRPNQAMEDYRNDGMFYGLNLDEEQRNFVDQIMDPSKLVVFCNAKAGTGKTTIAAGAAGILVDRGLYNGMTYLRTTPLEGALGFTPGDVAEKELKYMYPIYDALEFLNFNPDKVIEQVSSPEEIKAGTAWVSTQSVNFLRGTNISKRFVIIDEAQNFTIAELRTTLSRIHDDCKVVVIGCTTQQDIPNSGFIAAMNQYSQYDWVATCKLTKNYRGLISSVADDLV